MRGYAQKQSKPQQQASHNHTKSSAKPLATGHLAHPILNMQRPIGNQVVQRLLQANAEALEPDSDTFARTRFGHDFSRMPLHTKAHEELEQPPFRLSAHVPPTLPAATPAWTVNGEVNMGPAGLFLAPQEQKRILRHEAFHRLHQRIAPVSDTVGARAEAERLAANAESGFGANSLPVAMTPAPALLAFPPQAHPPWDRVWIGGGAIIGEVTEEGVVVRILLSYSEIGVTSAPGAQVFHCGKQKSPLIPEIVASMRKAAKQAAALNNRITQKDYPLKTALIAISKGANSSFRVAGGKGLLVVKREESWEEVIAHEAGHGIFAFHLGDRIKQGAPDSLAKAMTEVFLELKNTTEVSQPTGKFDPKHLPPLKDDGQTTTRPVGLVMVADVLWSGSGGHPWDSVDEFFASAFGAYQQKPLFEKIVAHYSRADTKIPPLAKKLFDLLAKVGDPKAIAALKPPADTKAVDAELKRIQPSAEAVGATTELLIDPAKLPGPATILCPGAKPSGKG